MTLLLLWLACSGGEPTPDTSPTEVAVREPSPVEPPPPTGPPFAVPEPLLGADPCAASWEEFEPFAASITTASAGRKPVPTKEAFLGACKALPAEVQPCMSGRYAIVHPDECQSRFDALPSADRDALYKALARPPAP